VLLSGGDVGILRAAVSICIGDLGDDELSTRTGFTMTDAAYRVRALTVL
jgi:hypothetical protein